MSDPYYRPLRQPEPGKSVEEYLMGYSVLDGEGNMDGLFVPLSVAHLAVELAVQEKLELKKPSWISE
jgi:hypothetical protein